MLIILLQASRHWATPILFFTDEAMHGSTLVGKTRGTRLITLLNTVGNANCCVAVACVRAYTLAMRGFSELLRQDLCDVKPVVGKIAAGRGFVPRVTCHLPVQEAGGSLLTGEGPGSYFMQMSHVRIPEIGKESCCFFASPSHRVQARPGLCQKRML